MSEQEFRRALGYANSAMDLLKRGQIPPYPQFYELLYTYATGVNPSLNQRVNQIFRDGTATQELADQAVEGHAVRAGAARVGPLGGSGGF